MLEKEYEQLVEYLKGMIADGVQFTHGGHLLDWHDTNILDLLQEIDLKKSEAATLTCEIGEPLINRISGESAYVFLITDDTIQMSPAKATIIYPKDKIWDHYRKAEPND